MATKKPMLAENKTTPTSDSVEDYLNTIENEQKRKDSFVLLELMKKASKEKPVLWSNSFIGFGYKIHKSPATGREAEWFRIGFAPRKANLSVYFGSNVQEHAEAIKKLGKCKPAMGCLYINKLADVDLKVLKGMIEAGCKLK